MSHLLPELSSDVALSLDAVEAVGLQATVSQHLDDLGVLLPVLLEDELPFIALVLVLASPPVLASLSCTAAREQSLSTDLRRPSPHLCS